MGQYPTTCTELTREERLAYISRNRLGTSDMVIDKTTFYKLLDTDIEDSIRYANKHPFNYVDRIKDLDCCLFYKLLLPGGGVAYMLSTEALEHEYDIWYSSALITTLSDQKYGKDWFLKRAY
jgi:hypothetical protein